MFASWFNKKVADSPSKTLDTYKRSQLVEDVLDEEHLIHAVSDNYDMSANSSDMERQESEVKAEWMGAKSTTISRDTERYVAHSMSQWRCACVTRMPRDSRGALRNKRDTLRRQRRTFTVLVRTA